MLSKKEFNQEKFKDKNSKKNHTCKTLLQVFYLL